MSDMKTRTKTSTTENILACTLTILAPQISAAESSTDRAYQAGRDKLTEIIAPDGVFEPSEPNTSTAFNLEAMRASASNQAGAAANTDPTEFPMADTIRFDVPVGVEISDQFAPYGIIFSGSGPKAIEDGSSPSNPVLSGSPQFDGDIIGEFVDIETGEPSSVYILLFDIGGFDEAESVLMEFFAPDGTLLFTRLNDKTGFARYAAFGGPKGIGSWRFSNVSTSDPDGFAIDNMTFSIPGLDNHGDELGITDCMLGNPVNPINGNKVQVETDYQQARAFPLKVERTYNSLVGEWQFLMRLEHVFGSEHARVIQPDGKRRTFSRLVDSNWLSINPELKSNLSVTRNPEGQPQGWSYQTSEDVTYDFDAVGRLVSAENRAGVRHDYTYSTDAITVTHSMDGTLVYHLDLSGRITGFTDPDAYTYSYEYNQDGMISAFTYPVEIGSPQKLYRYQDENHNDLLTRIVYNDTDQTYTFAYWFYDENRRATQSSHDFNTDTVLFDYANRYDPQYPRTTTTNALGKKTTYYFTDLNGKDKTFYVAGHPSENCQAANQAYGYYQSGYLYSSRDWNGYTTVYERNAKGQETRRIEAINTPEERSTTTEWHSEFELPVRISVPGRTTTLAYDSSGNLIQRRIEDRTSP